MKIYYAHSNYEDGKLRADLMGIYKDNGEHIEEEHIGPFYGDVAIIRDVPSCEDIINYMKLAYEAGKNGEKLTIEPTEWYE